MQEQINLKCKCKRNTVVKTVYINKYIVEFQIMVAMDSDPNCKKMQLAQKLENVAYTLDGSDNSHC